MERLGIVGSWDPRWIEDHRTWLESHGPHHDGWKNRMSVQQRDLLREQIARHGLFYFFAYIPGPKWAEGRVAYRLPVVDFEYLVHGRWFRHEPGSHHKEPTYIAHFIFPVTAVEAIEPRPLRSFVTPEGAPIEHPAALLCLPLVRDDLDLATGTSKGGRIDG